MSGGALPRLWSTEELARDWWQTFDRCMAALHVAPTDDDRLMAHHQRREGRSAYAAAAAVANMHYNVAEKAG